MKNYYQKSNYDDKGEKVEKGVELKKTGIDLPLRFCKNEEVN